MFWKKEVPEPSFMDKFGKKENILLPTLKTVISSLEKDIVSYSWIHQNRCNCGVIVQALLNVDKDHCGKILTLAQTQSGWKRSEEETGGPTWRVIAQNSCSVTGIPLKEVFIVLENKGLKIEDIVHLEYLNNPAILQLSKIDATEHYYTKRENLILYLKAWVKILEGRYDSNDLTDNAVLEAKLLIAVNAEKYEEAAEIRNQLISL